MTELEKLLAQREELDKKIKKLTFPEYVDDAEIVKLSANKRNGKPTGNWTVTIQTMMPDKWQGTNAPQRKVIIEADSKDFALDCIESLVYSLTTVYHRAKGEHWDGKNWVEDDA